MELRTGSQELAVIEGLAAVSVPWSAVRNRTALLTVNNCNHRFRQISRIVFVINGKIRVNPRNPQS